MNSIDRIYALLEELNKRGEYMPLTIKVGIAAYNEIKRDVYNRTMNPYAGLGSSGYNTLRILSPYGDFIIKYDPEQPANHIGVNGRTLEDIIVEEILLGEE